jgi:hypothetical protein
MAKRKQIWQPGDFFTVPLMDGTYTLGQVIKYEPRAMNSALCTFYSRCFDLDSPKIEESPTDEEVVAVLFVTRDLLDSGVWHVFKKGVPMSIKAYVNLEAMESADFIGVRIIGSGIVRQLMNAYNGLSPWNDFYDSNYLDKLLVSPDKKPLNVVMK